MSNVNLKHKDYAAIPQPTQDNLLDCVNAVKQTLEAITGVRGGSDSTALTSATLPVSTTVLKGDLTGTGTGTVPTTIAAHAVSFAKIQQIATNTVLGNPTGSTADIQAASVPTFLDLVSSTRGSMLVRLSGGWGGVSPGTSGYIWTSAGAGADPSWQPLATTNPWTLVGKTTDQTISSSTTFASDSALQFAAAANKTYAIRGMVFLSTPANNGGWKLAATGPTSPTRFSVNGVVAYDTIFISSAPDTVAGFFVMQFNALLQTGANAGTFAIRFAQSTSNANGVTSCKGSYLEYTAIV